MPDWPGYVVRMMREVVEARRGVATGADGEPRSILARAGGEVDSPLVGSSLGSTLGDSNGRLGCCDCSFDTEDEVSMRACSPSIVAAMTAWLVSSFCNAPRIWASMMPWSAMMKG